MPFAGLSRFFDRMLARLQDQGLEIVLLFSRVRVCVRLGFRLGSGLGLG